MKKSLLAVAAMTAFAGAASAQSSVTLFGIVDAGVARLSAGGSKNTGMTNSGLNSSRIGFRGVEDIGGGLKAGFWLEGGLGNDEGATGGSNTRGASVFFNRRSTVSLMGGFGEIRLGRDYTPTFWNTTVYDPFGTNGVGQSLTPGMLAGNANSTHAVRADNQISYFLPAMGGVTGQFSAAFGETINGKTIGYYGARVGYAAGPVGFHVAVGKTSGSKVSSLLAQPGADAADAKYINAGASFNLGAVNLMLLAAQEKNGAGLTIRALQPGVVVPLGAGNLKFAYGHYDVRGSDNDWRKLAVGYDHAISKRTTVYTTLARVSNKGNSQRPVANNGLTAPTPAAGGNASGFEFGLRHAF